MIHVSPLFLFDFVLPKMNDLLRSIEMEMKDLIAIVLIFWPLGVATWCRKVSYNHSILIYILFEPMDFFKKERCNCQTNC